VKESTFARSSLPTNFPTQALTHFRAIQKFIDEEIKKLITKGLTSAKKVLTQKIDTLHKIAKELISKETLEQKEFYALVR